MTVIAYFCFLAVILGAKSASAPFIKPCKGGDNACIVSSAQAALPIIAAGIPELGIKSIDPMHLEVIKGDQGGLALTFKDTTVTGMKGCNVDGIKHDIKKAKQIVTIRCSVDLNGLYKLDGQLLVLPIKGEGKYNIKIRDIVIKTTTELKTVPGADGKQHWHIDSWKFASQVKTSARFDFDNLFNGNKILAGPVEDFVNTNWRDVMQEIAPPIVHAIVARVVEGVEALYKAVPANELFIE
ncbi:circadian clock-controlled protein-like [Trichoplusia ni]|uniref:Circadian clock-controlled protein-like n=1 Tax=Trichoplusia ni TaxID=7111 RepID=A0A7E5WUC9_TRINI|nr:circadian clock-controlled protein-like [Trichoplusia ni]